MFKNKCRLHLQCLVVAIMMMLMVPFLTGFDVTRHITVKVDGQTKELRTNSSKPQKIIAEAGVVMEPGDGFRLLGANRNVQDGSVIEVIRGIPFTVIRGEETKEYKSSKATVGEALKDIGIVYRKERVYPDVGDKLQQGMQIYVLNKGEELHFSEEAIEVPVTYEEDHNLDFGNEDVKHPGKEGKSSVVSLHKKNSDGTTQIKELGRNTIIEPESKIIRKGMAMSVYTPEGYKRYSKKMIANATAYVATGNRTSLGIVPYEGIVAVDPRVIPYYTKMYIPGYGMAMAGDTGGDMVGNRIDLFFNSYNRAIQFGRRNVEVYILAE